MLRVAFSQVAIRVISRRSRGVVASARKSGTGCGAVACWGLGLVVVLGLPGLAVAGMMVRAARDAEPLWDKSPFISLALGPDPVGRFLLP